MSHSEADRIINEVVNQITTLFESRFNVFERRLERVETDIKQIRVDVNKLKRQMDALQETNNDILAEQKLLRHVTISNLNDVMRLKDRLEPRHL